MNEIKLNISKAEESINSYKEIIKDMTQAYEKLKIENETLKNRWNGQSADIFRNYCEIIEKKLYGRIKELEKLCNSLNEAKDTFVESDKNILK